jgi:hypothetical protein
MRGTVMTLVASLVFVVAPLTGQVPDTVPAPEVVPVAAASVETEASYGTSFMTGRGQGLLHGRDRGAGGWFAVGFGSGLFLPLVGPVVTYAAAGSESLSSATAPVSVLAFYQDQDPGFHAGFRDGYRDAVLSRRKTSALTGGLVGTVTYGVIVLLVVASVLGE